MKKAFFDNYMRVYALSLSDHKIIKEDDEYIDNKYVNINGVPINSYFNDIHSLKKNDIIVRVLYYMRMWDDPIDIHFRDFKMYTIYRNDTYESNRVKNQLQNKDFKNSITNIDDKKQYVIDIFSKKIKMK